MSSRAKRSRVQEKEKEKEAFLCPISHEVMRDPVMTVDGHTYDRANIEQVLKTSSLSPKTGLQLPDRRLIPNIALRHAMEEAGFKNLVPIELPGPTTQEQAEKFAREIIARSHTKDEIQLGQGVRVRESVLARRRARRERSRGLLRHCQHHRSPRPRSVWSRSLLETGHGDPTHQR